MSSETPISKDDEQIIAAAMESPEAVLTVHQDPGNPGRVMFSIDLSGDGKDPATITSIPTCDFIVMTLFTLAMRKGPEFTDAYNAVGACIEEMTAAQLAGASPDELRAIREKHNVHFRVG